MEKEVLDPFGAVSLEGAGPEVAGDVGELLHVAGVHEAAGGACGTREGRNLFEVVQ